MNLTLAVGDIPEFMPGIPPSMLQDMALGDVVANITDVFEATAEIVRWLGAQGRREA